MLKFIILIFVAILGVSNATNVKKCKLFKREKVKFIKNFGIIVKEIKKIASNLIFTGKLKF